MKLLKGIFVIALVSIIAVSCKDAKKVDAEAQDAVEVVADDANTVVEGAEIAVNHKCSDAKCSADCTEKDCAKCAVKSAECKAKCAAKKAGDAVEGAVDAAGEVVDDAVEGAKKAGDAVVEGAKDAKDAVVEGADKLKKAID